MPLPPLPLLLALLSLAPPALAAPACPTPTHAAELSAKVNSAEQAYATFEVETFASSLDEASLILPCIEDVVPADVSAHYLRMLGLRYFIERDPTHADQAFAAARSIDAAYVFPDSLIPAGHSVRTHYTAIDLSTVVPIPIAAARTGSILFDGAPATLGPPAISATQRPGLPAIVQIKDAAGAITATAYVLPGDPLPPYDAVPMPVAVGSAVRRPMSPKVPFAIGAGVAAVGAGTLYALSVSSRQDFETYREEDSIQNLTSLRNQTNAEFIGSVSAGVLALAGGVGAVLVGKW